MCLGNFVVQKPSEAQVEALNRTVAQLCAHYRIAPKDVYTHREWKGAQTACPGDNLQSKVRLLRKSGFKSSALA
jgi:N-acetyl-anhydromuramyl-L-alanine amidase AmpD